MKKDTFVQKSMNNQAVNDGICLEEYTFPKVVQRPVFAGKIQPINAAKYKALTSPDGNVYSIVSRNYHLIKHEDAVGAVIKELEKFPEYGKPTITVYEVDKGRRFRTNFRFDESKYILNGMPENSLFPCVDLYNSYDTGWSFQLWFGSYRIACSNGLVAGDILEKVRKKHVGDLSPEYIQECVKLGLSNMSEQYRIWESWVDVNLEQKEKEHILEEMKLSDKSKGVITNLEEVTTGETTMHPVTKWIYFNILMQWITHNVHNEVRRKNLQDRSRSLFYNE